MRTKLTKKMAALLPSSVHEVILLLDKGEMSVRELETMVQEINQEEVQPADRLSDSVYHYDAKERSWNL